MPSVSKKQHNLMAAVAKNPKFAKKVGIPQTVGEDFLSADKGRKFNKGGEMKNEAYMKKERRHVAAMKKAGVPKKIVKEEMEEAGMKKGGACKKMAEGGMPDQANKSGAIRGLERAADMSGRTMPTTGKPVGMKKGGRTKCMADGGVPPVTTTATPARPMPQATLPSQANIPTLPSQASDRAKAIMAARLAARTPAKPATTTTTTKMARGGGVETKGKTRGTMVKMARGGGVEVKGKTRGKMV